MNRHLMLAYGLLSYFLFFATFLYTIGFVGNRWVPRSIDSGREGSPGPALLVDLLLLGLFAIPHSVMARPWFKEWWTRIIPAPVERSTYVLASSLLLAVLCWQWRPIPAIVWEVTNPGGRWFLLALFWAGWGLVLVSTIQIDHLDLFGLRQVYLHAAGRHYSPVEFKTPGLYRVIRHPLMTGFLIAFWSAPTMTAGHLLFAAGMTAYILIALRFEERDLERVHGERYRDYRRQAAMLLPLPKLRGRSW
jgi:protein-S-isoprenylcysteine O-methyltransferase Ste14